MTPKENAQNLFDAYEKILLQTKYHISGFAIPKMAKECAVACVDEILSASFDCATDDQEIEYWNKVKKEINKL
jgi:hypothetical protein